MWTIGSYTKMVTFLKKYCASFKTIYERFFQNFALEPLLVFLQWKGKYTGGKVSPMINRVKEIWILKIVKHFVQKLNNLTILQINKSYPENARPYKHIYHDQDTSGHLRKKFFFFYHYSHNLPFKVLSQMYGWK